MAQNEMTAMRGMPQCVRLNEGLGVPFTLLDREYEAGAMLPGYHLPRKVGEGTFQRP